MRNGGVSYRLFIATCKCTYLVVISKQSMRRGGSPLQQRANGGASLELMFAIEGMDRVLRFAYSEMVAYDKRIGDERRLDALVRSMERLAISSNLVLDNVGGGDNE